MAASLTWKRIDDRPTFAVSGGLTELADLARLQAELGAETELDLGGITQVNSTGVREWLKFIHSVAAANQRLILRRCSVTFVNQLNMIRRFAGGAHIASILAPYICPACETASERVLDLVPGLDPNAKIAEPLPCPSCGTLMAFDDLPAVYFSFLDNPS